MKTLTPLQRKALFMGIRPAAIEVGEDPEVYRKCILKEELGVEHLDEVSRNGGFDKLMSRIWADGPIAVTTSARFPIQRDRKCGSSISSLMPRRRSSLRRPTTTATSTSTSWA